ncbi:MAG: ATP-binding protein [Thermoguttaceae bacterium]|jgi:signal transduction histidine kinase
MPDVKFRVSSGLKTIIGRDLITDDFVAVFELVKNAFDAHAKRVDIIFENLGSEDARLIIRDNGKGMNKADLKKKWLFVAYSAKKDGKEDDYRERIRSSRIYTGAKGIGRFSCDKLGRGLKLLTKKGATEKTYCVTVDWDKFEEDAQKEFTNIPVSLAASRKSMPNLTNGTVLVITGLRESWDRDKLLRLKRSLEKLINPNQGNDSQSFSVHLHAKDELSQDKKVPKDEKWNRVNGRIKNFLFEALAIKSTVIRVTIPEDGKNLTTRLEDRGKFIYSVVEENKFNLHGIDIHLFALNQSAKNTFTRHMGIPSVQFGSVFLFKNGFRIYPFGEEGEDSWGIDRRKQQGTQRFLGTRDLIGRFEINGDNPSFQEASSRDGGLIKTPQVGQLRELFVDYALKRLERFAVDIIKYGNKELPEGEYHSKALELILQLTKSKTITKVDYNPKILDILQEASEKSLQTVVTQFRELAEKSGNPQLERDAKRAERRIRELETAREEAEEETAKAEAKRKKAEAEAEEQANRAAKAEQTARKAKKKVSQVESQNLFLKSLVSADTENLVGLHHHIGIAAGTIQNYIKSMTARIRSGKPVSAEMFLSTLEKISLQASQINASSQFATKANFAMDAAKIEKDFVEFVREYIMNVCKGVILTHQDREMAFEWKSDPNTIWTRRFRPFEVAVLLDNLISNSKKADAKKVSISASENSNGCLEIRIRDDGKGIPTSVGDKVFDLGYTTTNGSGFGLYHAAIIAKDLGGALRLNAECRTGAEFIWEISK